MAIQYTGCRLKTANSDRIIFISPDNTSTIEITDNNNEVNILVSKDNLFAVKITNTKIGDYNFDKKAYEELNISFSKSFFNDFSNFYLQHLASKHNLKRNYQELNKFFIQKENVN